MSNEIYPQSVFGSQNNGTVFYREGKLNDPTAPAQQGIFESWRYSFDDGKQVFRATDSNKVYEKRILKDKYGNPYWSDWMEISDTEVSGVKAIAINDRPLLLPNSEGAIRLQITPSIIGAYTKREVHELIESKIRNADSYIYVPWNNSLRTAEAVLNSAYPSGGEENKIYVLEPKLNTPGITETVLYYIWTQVSSSSYDWRPVNPVNLTAFVSYPVFDDHRNDDVAHLTQEQRDAFETRFTNIETKDTELETAIEELNTNLSNANTVANEANEKIAALEENVETLNSEIEETASIPERFNIHENDLGEVGSKHITAEERMRWNDAALNIMEYPENDDTVYGVMNEKIIPAIGQLELSESFEETTVKNFTTTTHFLENDTEVLKPLDGLSNTIRNLESNGKIITSCFLQTYISQIPADSHWWIQGDNGFVSRSYNAEARSQERIDLPLNNIPNSLIFRLSDEEGQAAFNYIRIVIQYKNIINAKVGVESAPLNLVGPENQVPKYNGVPISKYSELNASDFIDELNIYKRTSQTTALQAKDRNDIPQFVTMCNDADGNPIDVTQEYNLRLKFNKVGNLITPILTWEKVEVPADENTGN